MTPDYHKKQKAVNCLPVADNLPLLNVLFSDLSRIFHATQHEASVQSRPL
jgi:hypothetical protein